MRLDATATRHRARTEVRLAFHRDAAADSPPAFDGGSGQQDVAAYIDPYVEDGKITLDDNQAIYLFDFNANSYDYQDAVLLVSFFTRKTQQVGVHESKSRDVVLCPAETKSASPNGESGN